MNRAGPLSRGVHHLALNTDDMKTTLDFYVGVLGMPLVHALKVAPGLGTAAGNRGNPPFENIRHHFLAREEALEGLKTLSEDAAWLETLVAHLPERR